MKNGQKELRISTKEVKKNKGNDSKKGSSPRIQKEDSKNLQELNRDTAEDPRDEPMEIQTTWNQIESRRQNLDKNLDDIEKCYEENNKQTPNIFIKERRETHA